MDKYFKEIENVGWISELISERFDNALEIISEIDCSAIYGGAIRDLMSGRKIEGDLDVLVTPQKLIELRPLFSKNPKWIEHSVIEDKNKVKKEIKNYGGPGKIKNITSFVNYFEAVVQLISAKDSVIDEELGIPTKLVRTVDMVCCGMVLLNNGKVFEMVPNAYEDSRKNELNFNIHTNDIIDIEKLKERIVKLSNRGWDNRIDIDVVIEHNKKLEEKKKKNKEFEMSSSSPLPTSSSKTLKCFKWVEKTRYVW